MKTVKSLIAMTLGTSVVLVAILSGATRANAAVIVDHVVSATGGGTINTQPFGTSSPNEIVVAFVASDGPQSGGQTLTVSGAGLVWSLVRRANAQPGTSEIWMATAPTILSNATVTSTQSAGGYRQSLTVISFTGATGVGASADASSQSAASYVLLTTTQAQSLVFGVGNDWDSAVPRTVATDQTLIHQDIDTVAADTFWVQRITEPIAAAGKLVAVADTAPITDRWNLAAVEIVAVQPATTQTGPAIDQVASADGGGRLTTQTFNTSSPGELIVALAASDGPSSGGQRVTVSGAGLAWSLVRRANLRLGTSEIWSAMAPAALSNATVTSTQRFGGYRQSLTVVAFTGTSGVGASAGASGADGAPAVLVTTTRAGSLVVGVGNDWDNAIPRIAAADQVVIHHAVDTSIHDTFWVQATDSTVASAGTPVQLADTAPTTDQWNFAALEILASTEPVSVITGPAVAPSIFFDGLGTISTPAFTTTGSNEVLVAFVASDGPSSQPQSVTLSGAGLSWSLVRRANTQAGTAEIWSATATTPLVNATVTSTPAIEGYHQSLTVVTFDGASAVGASGAASAAQGAPAVSLTTTQAGSLIYGVGNDWDRAIARRVDANQVIVHQWVETDSGDTFWVQALGKPIPSAGATVQLRDAAPTTDRWNFAAIEITRTAPTGTDTVPPVVTAVPSPSPNANGWNKTNVTVSFSCADVGSGIATCPDPVIVSTEGASQVVSGTAVDKAGNTATVSVSLNIDKTEPLVSAESSPPPNADGWNDSPVTVHVTCEDALAGVETCSADQILSTDGTGLTAILTAVDRAGNVASATSGPFNIDSTRPIVTVALSPAPNARGWNRSPVTAHFTCTDVGSGVATCPPDQVISSDGANQTIQGSATDHAGHAATVSTVVNLDTTSPGVHIVAPTDGVTLGTATVDVNGGITEALAGIASATCNGAPASIFGSTFRCTVTLQNGTNQIAVVASDVAGNIGAASVGVGFAITVPGPRVTFTSPAALTVFNGQQSPITVAGSVDDANAAVLVTSPAAPNGVQAGVSDGTWQAQNVPLREGHNLLTVAARNAQGGLSSATLTVTLDTTPPIIRIDGPAGGALLTTSQISVTGVVNDIVPGTVNSEEVHVQVNGLDAEVSNRSFAVRGLLLARGQNTLVAVATDRAGNQAQTQVQVTLQDNVNQQRIQIVSGNEQTGVIETTLEQPLGVRLIDAAGAPVGNRAVTFRVVKSDGILKSGDRQAQELALTSDDQGRASALFLLGTRSGVGNNQVAVTVPGFSGTVTFSESARVGPASQINIVSGENQRGPVGQPLPLPFVVIVYDQGGNPVANVPVMFKVLQGGGALAGRTDVTINTNSDGKVDSLLTLGEAEGINNQVVAAGFGGDPSDVTGSQAVTFHASGIVPGRATETRVSGIVVDNAEIPIPNATASLVGANLSARTDEQGRFSIAGAPVGTVTLIVDGSTTTRRETFPFLAFVLNTVTGVDNTIGMPIYIPPLDAASAKLAGGDQDAVLMMEGVPGVAFTVAPHSTTLPDGRHEPVLMMLSQVHADKVPMPPPNGSAPRLVWTLQPAGVKFDPPIQVQLPNTDGFAAGQVIEIFQFDHDLEQFVSTGPGRVSPDGSVIVSDRGFGITKSGWGAPQPPPPPKKCVGGCGPCKTCKDGACVPANAGGACNDGNDCTINDKCTASGTCKGDDVKVTAITGACVAAVSTATNFTATSDAPDKVKWQAPAGTPASGTGASFSVQYAAEGDKVVTAACGASSKTKNVTVGPDCATIVAKLNQTEVSQAPDANPPGGKIFGQVHPQSHSAKYKGCVGGGKWCFRLEEFLEKHGVGTRSNGNIDVPSATAAVVTPVTCPTIIADFTPPGAGTGTGPPRGTYYSASITLAHENFHVSDYRDKIVTPSMNDLAAFVSQASHCTDCKTSPPAAFNTQMETIWRGHLPTFFDGNHEVRAHNVSNPMYTSLIAAIRARARGAPAAAGWPAACK